MNWTNKRVLLTGHSGFKGGWLSLWLKEKGAELCGVSLPQPAQDNLFEDADVARGMQSVFADIRDTGRITKLFAEFRPEIVFHLAAQPLVRASYQDPIGTYSTNVMGTCNVLEGVRAVDSVRAVVVITTDKCYQNQEWLWPYREADTLGGYDPYSNSKACAELVVSAYRSSFFNPASFQQHGVAIATARAGNVIGGGDWAEDRLIPDLMRAFSQGRSVQIRNANATRPWQHVLEPLRGYIALAEALCQHGPLYGEAWNFGPDQMDSRPVEWLVNEVTRLWGQGASWENESGEQPHEAQKLQLDSSKAASRLGWKPRLPLSEALAMTVQWYQARQKNRQMRAMTIDQIRQYENRTTSQ